MTTEERARASAWHEEQERKCLQVWLDLLRQAEPEAYAELVGA